MQRRRVRTSLPALGIALAVVLAGCKGDPDAQPTTGSESTPASASPSASPPTTAPSATTPPAATPTPSSRPAPGTVPPAWLGRRVLPVTTDGFGEVRPTPPALRNRRFTLPDQLPALPGSGFASRIVSPPPDSVIDRSTWRAGCPVARSDLAWIRLTFWGFDDARHTGELLVNKTVARKVVRAFRAMYAARFPIEEMRITRAAELSAPPTGDGNNTGAFNCRPTRGTTTFSQHAYGLAVDINPFQNPYVKGDLVLPELATAYVDRNRVRPGMILAGGPVVRAFETIGWGWGGAWRTLKDYQHFSRDDR
ncbi:M15 family metallopeptidase [Mumia sp. zg.B21]|uniref:M15 family metallopeptidase n=1 Tax=Mumia sp. zg.B21 TaxID=2855447 RepID=UPI001C6EEFBB|nr:M15 family metallopeptidase [Mumia sp. zg.B21]MBW9209865.1 M15 family metallopeptidase [Mumia sp. zg.B21]